MGRSKHSGPKTPYESVKLTDSQVKDKNKRDKRRKADVFADMSPRGSLPSMLKSRREKQGKTIKNINKRSGKTY